MIPLLTIMLPTRSSQAQRGTHVTRGIQSSAAQRIPSTNFTSHFVIGDGDCLFRGVHMELTNQPGVQANNQQIMGLRQAVANYVTEHRQALIAHPSFDGEAGVNKLYGLLMTQGQWNEDAGDLVAPILAQVLGREVRILESAPQGGFYELNDNRIFRPQDPALPAGKPDTGQPPIHLLHTNNGNHYEYLESRSSQADATSEINVISEAVRQTVTPREDMHKHFGIDGLEILSQEPWSNDDWGKSVFMQLNNINNPMCVHKDLLKHSFEDTKFGNAIGGNAEGHYSRLGGERYLKVPEGNTNFYLLTNQESKASIDHLKQHVDDADNELAAVLSLEFIHKARIASVALNRDGEERVGRGSSVSHGQSEYSVYKLVGHQKKSIEQAEELAMNGKSLFDGCGVLDQGLNRQGGSSPQTDRNDITNAFERIFFGEPMRDGRGAGVPRISERRAIAEEQSISPETVSHVQLPVNFEDNRRVQSRAARTEIMNAFTQTANGRAFGDLTSDEQDVEVERISQATGYRQTGIRATLIHQSGVY